MTPNDDPNNPLNDPNNPNIKLNYYTGVVHFDRPTYIATRYRCGIWPFRYHIYELRCQETQSLLYNIDEQCFQDARRYMNVVSIEDAPKGAKPRAAEGPMSVTAHL